MTRKAAPLLRHRLHPREDELMPKHFLPFVAMVTGMMSTMAGAQSTPDNPLHLIVKEEGTSVEIRVVGTSQKPLQLRYDLIFEGDSNSRNKGAVRLDDGVEKTLATVRMSTRGPWQATLIVSGDLSYEQVVKATNS